MLALFLTYLQQGRGREINPTTHWFAIWVVEDNLKVSLDGPGNQRCENNLKFDRAEGPNITLGYLQVSKRKQSSKTVAGSEAVLFIDNFQ